MGLFHKNRITITKKTIDNKLVYFIDSSRIKDKNGFKFNILRDLSEGSHFLVVIDTNLLYYKSDRNIESEVKELTDFLEEQGIIYREIVMKSESNQTILGIPFKMGNDDKIKNHIIGFTASLEDLMSFNYNIDQFNPIYYVLPVDITNDTLLDKFYEIRGDMEELNGLFESNIRFDDYTETLRICPVKNKADAVLQIIEKLSEQSM